MVLIESNDDVRGVPRPPRELRHLDIAVVTIDRPENYIHQLLSGIRGNLSVRLIVGACDIRYLEQYRESPFIQIVVPPEREWTHFKECCVQQRACWNYWRALSLGANGKPFGDLLICEDDVIVSRGWEERLCDTLNEIESVLKDEFALALYTVFNLHPTNSPVLASYPVERFFGTQAMYYPKSVRIGFSKYLHANGVDHYRRPYDLLLREYLGACRIQLFATVPCLVQHVGEISTGLGVFHQASCFQEVL